MRPFAAVFLFRPIIAKPSASETPQRQSPANRKQAGAEGALHEKLLPMHKNPRRTTFDTPRIASRKAPLGRYRASAICDLGFRRCHHRNNQRPTEDGTRPHQTSPIFVQKRLCFRTLARKRAPNTNTARFRTAASRPPPGSKVTVR
ncbi:UNVERIFIED_ORG: hypothetical protein QOE_2693 [Clostridioides difficile F501]